jgi:hypothetical protein
MGAAHSRPLPWDRGLLGELIAISIGYAQIQTDLAKLRSFVLGDIDRMLELEPGVNYAAAVVIACGFEALANVRDGRENAGQQPFAETLPARWRPVASSLFDALRNGIVHGYETQLIRVGDQTVELAIAWRVTEHLMWYEGQLVLNVRALAACLRERFDDYDQRLRADGSARDLFFKRRRRQREHQVRGDEAVAWRSLIPNS